MSDQELLELAAKAAGYKFYRSKFGHWIVTTPEGDRVECCVGFIRYDSYTGADLGLPSVEDALSELGWSPREDDGDALRLAVRLGINIYLDDDEECSTEWNSRQKWAYVECGDDKDAAARLAIFRAAAEIGNAMP